METNNTKKTKNTILLRSPWNGASCPEWGLLTWLVFSQIRTKINQLSRWHFSTRLRIEEDMWWESFASLLLLQGKKQPEPNQLVWWLVAGTLMVHAWDNHTWVGGSSNIAAFQMQVWRWARLTFSVKASLSRGGDWIGRAGLCSGSRTYHFLLDWWTTSERGALRLPSIVKDSGAALGTSAQYPCQFRSGLARYHSSTTHALQASQERWHGVFAQWSWCLS